MRPSSCFAKLPAATYDRARDRGHVQEQFHGFGAKGSKLLCRATGHLHVSSGSLDIHSSVLRGLGGGVKVQPFILQGLQSLAVFSPDLVMTRIVSMNHVQRARVYSTNRSLSCRSLPRQACCAEFKPRSIRRQVYTCAVLKHGHRCCIKRIDTMTQPQCRVGFGSST